MWSGERVIRGRLRSTLDKWLYARPAAFNHRRRSPAISSRTPGARLG